VLSKREKNRLLVFERKVLRTIYGPHIVDGLYKRRYNLELDSPYDVIVVVKNNRLRYAGHMLRVAEVLRQRALYKAVPDGRRNQGRPKSRCVDGVSSDSRALGAYD
jgi:hypothetical protein